jgi:hypothetical protein
MAMPPIVVDDRGALTTGGLRIESMLSHGDVEYIRENFVALQELCAARGMDLDEATTLIERGRLPRASYTLDDGTDMVPPDYFALYDAPGPDDVENVFRDRLVTAARKLGLNPSDAEVAAEWEGYLSGEYGVCLRDVTPESICAKGVHVDAIEDLLAEPRRADRDWLDALASNVDALDRLERPFAEFDRVRWGPVSRDRLITDVRERFPEAFAPAA